MRYTVIDERSATGYSAYVPVLPGLGVVAGTLEETKELIRTGIRAHVAIRKEHGEPVPGPTSSAEEIDVRFSD